MSIGTLPAAAGTQHELRIRALDHAFGRDEVLAGIDFRLRAGEVVALVGPSGCGKTTLLHLAAGLLTVQAGEVSNSFSSTAFMFQQPRLLPWKTALDNIALGLKAAGVGRDERHFRARELALRLGLAHRDLDKFPTSCRAACRAVLRLRARWCWRPNCCCSMSPSRRSMSVSRKSSTACCWRSRPSKAWAC